MLINRLPERAVGRYGLAALIGAAGVLCFAPFGLFWLAPVIWGGLFALLLRAESPRQGLLSGLAFGLGFFLCGVSWVYVSLSVFGGMPWWLAGIAAFLFCAVMALFPMLAGALFKRWQPADGWRQVLCFAALIATVDWLRSWIFTGFPWLVLGYSQGALVIGEAAVTAGLVGAPTIIVIALTAITTFVVPGLLGPGIFLRLIYTILAGVLGAYGILTGVLFTLLHLASLRSFGVPYLAPLAPVVPADLKDVLVRAPIWALGTRPRLIGWLQPSGYAADQEEKGGDRDGEGTW